MKVEIKPVLFIFFVFLFPLFIFPPKVSAQVVINEFSSVDSPDWIEIYNTSSSDAINLSGWIIKDTARSNVYEFSGELVSANESCFISVSTRLNNAGDKIQLYKDSTQKDCVAYGDGKGSFCNGTADVVAPLSNETASRIPDGTGSWVIGSSTKSNIECLTLVPTPTPTSTPTPTPGPTSTPTPTPTKTPTSTPKPTVKAVVTKKPKVISTKTTSDEEESEILGLREGLETPSPTPIPESEEKGKISITAILFVLGGLGFMGVAGYPFLKSMKKRYNIENEEKETTEGDFKPGDS